MPPKGSQGRHLQSWRLADGSPGSPSPKLATCGHTLQSDTIGHNLYNSLLSTSPSRVATRWLPTLRVASKVPANPGWQYDIKSWLFQPSLTLHDVPNIPTPNPRPLYRSNSVLAIRGYALRPRYKETHFLEMVRYYYIVD
jgi:hypothetical protein